MATRSPLHEAHARLGASFTDFAGFEMPLHYGSIKEEHMAVRNDCGLFDVGHMGKLMVRGDGAAEALSRATVCDAGRLKRGRGRYTVLLNDDATIIDDAFLFRLGDDDFLLVPNAGRSSDVAARVRSFGGDVHDAMQEQVILALQGPRAPAVLEAVLESGSAPARNRVESVTVAGTTCLATGTGYTGEAGCELFAPSGDAGRVWDAVLDAGKAHGIRPCGLGARDTLRLEKGYCLAGNEFAGGRTPLEAGLEWLVQWDHPFAGRDVLQTQKEEGAKERLTGLVQEHGVPRHGYPVHRGGQPVGQVTSGTQSPLLGKGIALAYLRSASEGDTVQVDVRGRPHDAVVTRPPFA